MLSPNGGLQNVACLNADHDSPLLPARFVGRRRAATAADTIGRPPLPVVATCTSRMKLAPSSPSGSSSKLSANGGSAFLAVPRAGCESATASHGLCYVVGDYIATNQIIPAESDYLTLVSSYPEKLGSYALLGLPASYEVRFFKPNETRIKNKIVIGEANLGCGSSREHARVALEAAGVVVVVAQIISTKYLTFVPSDPAEYEKLGSYTLIDLPPSYETRFVEPNEAKTKHKIFIGGANFGCGSSRKHAPVALGAAGIAAVVAQSYSAATGEVYPLETDVRIREECRTRDTETLELAESELINATGKECKLKPIADAGPMIEGGGILA